MTIIDDYLEEVGRHLRLPADKKRDVLGEMRTHLQAEAAGHRAAGMTRDEAMLQATHDFGAPEEIGIGHEGLVRRSTGEKILHVAALTTRAAGRGAGRVAKGTFIVALAVLGFAVVLALGILFFAGDVIDTFQDDIRESVPRPLYHYDGQWGQTEPQARAFTQTFDVGEHLKEFKVDIDVTPQTGCAGIELISPSGRTIGLNDQGCGPTSHVSTYVEKGTWTVRYTFVGFTGDVSVDAFGFEQARSDG